MSSADKQGRGGMIWVVQLGKSNTTPRDKLYDSMWSIAPYCTTRVVPRLLAGVLHTIVSSPDHTSANAKKWDLVKI